MFRQAVHSKSELWSKGHWIHTWWTLWHVVNPGCLWRPSWNCIAREYTQRYPRHSARCQPDTIVSRRLDQCFRKPGSLTPHASVSAGRPRSVTTIWPPRSPDFTKLDLFLRRHLKEYAYAVSPSSIEDLVAKLHAALTAVNTGMLRCVQENTMQRTASKCTPLFSNSYCKRPRHSVNRNWSDKKVFQCKKSSLYTY
jgi:hypothetical protein